MATTAASAPTPPPAPADRPLGTESGSKGGGGGECGGAGGRCGGGGGDGDGERKGADGDGGLASDVFSASLVAVDMITLYPQRGDTITVVVVVLRNAE